MPIFHIPTLAKLIGTKPYGVTLGPFIFIWGPLTPRAIAHERAHVKQWLADPILFYPKYLSELIRNKLADRSWYQAYLDISYEKKAREEAKNAK